MQRLDFFPLVWQRHSVAVWNFRTPPWSGKKKFCNTAVRMVHISVCLSFAITAAASLHAATAPLGTAYMYDIAPSKYTKAESFKRPMLPVITSVFCVQLASFQCSTSRVCDSNAPSLWT